MRRIALLLGVLVTIPILAAGAGILIGPGIVHPRNLNSQRLDQTNAVLASTQATKGEFAVPAPDGVVLRGWKLLPPDPSGSWVLLFHGVSDNRTGMLGPAEFLLRRHYSLVMMDARAHGGSGGDFATYGYLERFDTVAIVQALESSEKVKHLYALGVSMGAAIALQSAAMEPRIEAVVAEDPFSCLREVSYDYAGLDLSPLLGKTLFRPASFFALRSAAKEGKFNPDEVSPESAVTKRPFSVLLICGTEDRRIPCRHAEAIYHSAIGPKEIWEVAGAGHAGAFGHAPQEYEDRVITFFGEQSKKR